MNTKVKFAVQRRQNWQISLLGKKTGPLKGIASVAAIYGAYLDLHRSF